MNQRHLIHPSSFILHPSSFILHPSSFILHPSSFILHPSSFILHPSSFILHPSSFILHPSSFILHDPSSHIPSLCYSGTRIRGFAAGRRAVARRWRIRHKFAAGLLLVVGMIGMLSGGAFY